MSASGFWRVYALLAAIAVASLVIAAAVGLLWIVLPVMLLFGLWLGVLASRRVEKPLPAKPVAPIAEPGLLEGRVDRMTMEEGEMVTNPGTPWEGSQPATVYIIVISGLRYTIDPRPARRGAFDWLQEGMWVRATFDHKTRVIYNLQWIPAPTG